MTPPYTHLIWGLLVVASGCAAPKHAIHPASPSTSTPTLRELTFTAIDTETTGFNAQKHRVIEIGAVKFRNGQILSHRKWLVKPAVEIPLAVQRIHGITPAMVTDAPPIKDVLPQLRAFIKDTIVLAHNAPFDRAFLSLEFHRAQLEPPREKIVDTLRVLRVLYPDFKSHRLSSIAEEMQVKHEVAHRALADATMLANVFMKVIDALPKNTRLDDLVRMTRATPLHF